ncbi:MAG TPA: ROK family protein [Candidatus Aenigmarchaeota archaeon]|nr:ROK family protein [Candidatus Aenigmarchaeota archaeon]
MYKIAVVVGGTNTACALFKENKIVKKTERRTEVASEEKLIEFIVKLIEEMKGERKIKKIGIGIPGPLDWKKGIVLNPPNIPVRNFPLKRFLEKKFGVKVTIENDANCSALGIVKKKGVKDFVLLTLGTGVGGAIVVNGKLYRGMGNAGELGHITIEASGYKCTCGNRGCLEEYVSARGFERLAKKYLGKKLSPREIMELALKGNKKAKKIYEEVGRYLGIGLATISNILNPEIIFLTGKISLASSLLLRPAIKEMKKRVLVTPPKISVVKNMELYGAV